MMDTFSSPQLRPTFGHGESCDQVSLTCFRKFPLFINEVGAFRLLCPHIEENPQPANLLFQLLNHNITSYDLLSINHPQPTILPLQLITATSPTPPIFEPIQQPNHSHQASQNASLSLSIGFGFPRSQQPPPIRHGQPTRHCRRLRYDLSRHSRRSLSPNQRTALQSPERLWHRTKRYNSGTDLQRVLQRARPLLRELRNEL